MPLWLSDTSYMTHIDFNFITEAFKIKIKQFFNIFSAKQKSYFSVLASASQKEVKSLEENPVGIDQNWGQVLRRGTQIGM